ncbi:MAG TPA: hypothetical protein VML19_12040 [Verrucomicrobiae bacterium]|nr:hypothetical protein [Verrucomicrobiae bacterium]
MKIRARKFEGRCSKHKNYNPPVDGQAGIANGCARCRLLWDIWEASLKINQLIRRFDPKHDDLRKPGQSPAATADPRQMSLI